MEKNKKGVIYTCITGNYDYLSDHKFMHPDWDYICFSDNPKIRNRNNSRWEIRPLVFDELDSCRNQRWHKLHPQKLFPDYNVSLWIDGNVEILDKKFFRNVKYSLKNKRLISIAIHPERSCLYEEFEACIEQAKDDLQIMKTQVDQIREAGFPSNFGLFETNIILREHHDQKIIKVMDDWWKFIKDHSKRDQLSLTYVLWKNKTKAFPLSENSFRKKKDVVMFWPHIDELRDYFLNNQRPQKIIMQSESQSIRLLEKRLQDKEEEFEKIVNSLRWKIPNFIYKIYKKITGLGRII